MGSQLVTLACTYAFAPSFTQCNDPPRQAVPYAGRRRCVSSRLLSDRLSSQSYTREGALLIVSHR
jgi:hypothetical protein